MGKIEFDNLQQALTWLEERPQLRVEERDDGFLIFHLGKVSATLENVNGWRILDQ